MFRAVEDLVPEGAELVLRMSEHEFQVSAHKAIEHRSLDDLQLKPGEHEDTAEGLRIERVVGDLIEFQVSNHKATPLDHLVLFGSPLDQYHLVMVKQLFTYGRLSLERVTNIR